MDTDDIIASAEEAIASNGGTVTIVQLNPAVNLVAPSAGARLISQTQALSGVQLPASQSRTSKFDISSEDLKSTGLRFFLVSVAGMAFRPVANDIIEPLSGSPMTILGVNILEPNGTPLLLSILAAPGAVGYTLLDLSIAILVSGEDSYLATDDGSILSYYA